MELWFPAMTVLGIYTLAVMSPGPNFLVIMRNALAHSRRVGQRTALGVASGSILWVSFGFLGVAAVFSQAPVLFAVIKALGAGYLLYIAQKMVRSLKRRDELQPAWGGHARPSGGQAFRHGLLTQLSNPKAALFILALFSSAISPATPATLKLVMAATMIFISFTWYLVVATIFSATGIQSAYVRIQRPATLAFAGLLLWLSASLLFPF